MADSAGGIDLQEKLERLSRAAVPGLQAERALVRAPGAVPPAWTIQIVSNAEYNIYNVHQVRIVNPGAAPVLLSGSATQAVNLAESFTAAGSLPADTYAVMWRVGNKNVFYVAP